MRETEFWWLPAFIPSPLLFRLYYPWMRAHDPVRDYVSEPPPVNNPPAPPRESFKLFIHTSYSSVHFVARSLLLFPLYVVRGRRLNREMKSPRQTTTTYVVTEGCSVNGTKQSETIQGGVG